MSIYEILPALDLTQSVHAKISIGMHRGGGGKFKISRIPLIGLETRLGWRTDRKFLRNPNLNEIIRLRVRASEVLLYFISPVWGLITKCLYHISVSFLSIRFHYDYDNFMQIRSDVLIFHFLAAIIFAVKHFNLPTKLQSQLQEIPSNNKHNVPRTSSSRLILHPSKNILICQFSLPVIEHRWRHHCTK